MEGWTEEEIMNKEKVDLVVAIGPAVMMKFVCRTTAKYNVKTIFFSGAKEPYEMRNERDLTAFFNIL